MFVAQSDSSELPLVLTPLAFSDLALARLGGGIAHGRVFRC